MNLTARPAICVLSSIVAMGCSATSNDVGQLPMLYRPLEGISPGHIAGYTASQSLDLLTERLKTDPGNARLLEDRGWTFAQEGSYNRAVEDLKTAIELQSSRPDTEIRARLHCRLGITYYAMGQYPAANESFSAAIEIDADNWELYFHRWLALQAAGRDVEAEADQQKGLSLRPDVFELSYSPVGGII